MSDYNGPERRQNITEDCVLHTSMLHDLVKDTRDAKKDIRLVLNLLNGNGHPEDGVLFKQALNTDFRKRVEPKIDDYDENTTHRKNVWGVVLAIGSISLASLIPQIVGWAGHLMKTVADHGV